MKAMILAAGRGSRFREMTDTCPKPLIEVAGKALIVHRIEALAAAGIVDIIINVSYLGAMIIEALGDGGRWGVSIEYSVESPVQETAGGIIAALPLLGRDPFWCVSADIWTDFSFPATRLDEGILGHLICIPQASHCTKSDFGLINKKITLQPASYTYANIGLFSAQMFEGWPPGPRPLVEIFQANADAGRLSGEVFYGEWEDVGTPERWIALENKLKNYSSMDA